jgi:hypothetical protein
MEFTLFISIAEPAEASSVTSLVVVVGWVGSKKRKKYWGMLRNTKRQIQNA